MIQLSVIKLRGYGPWTLTLGSDREHELQQLQASIYGRLQGLLSGRGCLLFQNRGDELIAITNGLDMAGHREVLDSLECEVELSVSIGTGGTPLEADRAAHAARGGDICGEPGGAGEACILHLDVDGMTSRAGSQSAYETTSEMAGLYGMMSGFFLGYGSLAFFMGGDNFMVVAGGAAKSAVPGFLRRVREERGMRLNCGIGTAATGREAARLATESLDTVRKMRKSGRNPGIYELPC